MCGGRTEPKERNSVCVSIPPISKSVGTDFLLDFFSFSRPTKQSASQIPSAFYAGKTESLSVACRLLHVLILVTIW